MRRARKIPLKSKPKFAVVVEGECEFWYIQMLKRNERTIKVDLKPEIPQKKKLKDQYNKVKDLSKDYDKVFWIIDFDVILKEERENKSSIKPLHKFKEYYYQLENNYDNVVVIINNPCIEYWFLLHFVSTSRYFNNCSKSISELVKHIPQYEKSQKFFTKQDNDIYIKLKPYLNRAIENTNKLNEFDFENVFTGVCQMNRFYASNQLKQILEK